MSNDEKEREKEIKKISSNQKRILYRFQSLTASLGIVVKKILLEDVQFAHKHEWHDRSLGGPDDAERKREATDGSFDQLVLNKTGC